MRAHGKYVHGITQVNEASKETAKEARWQRPTKVLPVVTCWQIYVNPPEMAITDGDRQLGQKRTSASCICRCQPMLEEDGSIRLNDEVLYVLLRWKTGTRCSYQFIYRVTGNSNYIRKKGDSRA